MFYSDKVPFDSSQYEVKQVFYTSKDVTNVEIFIAAAQPMNRTACQSYHISVESSTQRLVISFKISSQCLQQISFLWIVKLVQIS